MKVKFILVILMVLNTVFVYSQESKFPYIFIKGSDLGEYTFKYGYYYEKNDDFKDQELHINQKIWIQNVVNQFSELPLEKQNLLIYIHGLWADNEAFFSYSLEKMNTHVYALQENPFGQIVSFKWDAGFVYDNNQALAIDKGRLYAKIYQDLISELKAINPNMKVSFLNHSMGNKLFESMYNTLANKNCQPEISAIIMAAPDVDFDVFENGQPLENLCTCADKIIVLHHPVDRTLSVSTKLNNKLRLGQIKDPPTNLTCKNIIFENVGNFDDNEDFTGKIGNHRYFYSSPTVRNMILKYLIAK